MRWTPGGVSDNIEDMRNSGGGGGGGYGRVGLGGLFIALILSLIFGRDFISPLISGGGAGGAAPSRPVSEARARTEDTMVQFLSVQLDDMQAVWQKIMPGKYVDAKLVLFRDAIRSGCGAAGAETGPFYCPADQKVYLDLSFFDELERRFGAPGDFAQAYVVAHEIGHHVQTLMGISPRVRQMQQRNPQAANQFSVALELQADCFAGIWGNSAARRDKLDPGDAQEGLAAAAAVGDDRLQKQARGYASPETFTHGSSESRMKWFRRGFESGDIRQCDTFNSR